MEFKEFTNPENIDYDLESYNNTDELGTYSNRGESKHDYALELYQLIGLLEDVTEEELQETYGISMNEYFKPNSDTIRKAKEKLNNNKNMSRR